MTKTVATIRGNDYTYPGTPFPAFHVWEEQPNSVTYHYGEYPMSVVNAVLPNKQPATLPNPVDWLKDPIHIKTTDDAGNVLAEFDIIGSPGIGMGWNTEVVKRFNGWGKLYTPEQIVAKRLSFPFGDNGLGQTRIPFKRKPFAGPLDYCNETAYEPTTGERPDLGMMTDPAAIFLETGNTDALFDWAETDASHPTHNWDSEANKPMDMVKYPTLQSYGANQQPGPYLQRGVKNANGNYAFNSAITPQQAHHPNFSYIAYLATGDLILLRHLQDNAAFMLHSDNGQTSVKGQAIIHGERRGVAWGIRDLLFAYLATKDAEDRGVFPANCLPSSTFMTLLENTRKYWETTITHPICQGYNIMMPEPRISPWEQDYLISVLQMCVLAGLTQWEMLYHFNLGNAIRRLDPSSGWAPAAAGIYRQNTTKGSNSTNTPSATQLAAPVMSWTDSFASLANDVEFTFTAAMVTAGQKDPFNGGVTLTNVMSDYWDDLSLVMGAADYLDRNVTNGRTRAVWPYLDTAMSVCKLFAKGRPQIAPRHSVKAAATIPVFVPTPVTTPPPAETGSGGGSVTSPQGGGTGTNTPPATDIPVTTNPPPTQQGNVMILIQGTTYRITPTPNGATYGLTYTVDAPTQVTLKPAADGSYVDLTPIVDTTTESFNLTVTAQVDPVDKTKTISKVVPLTDAFKPATDMSVAIALAPVTGPQDAGS